VQIATASLTEPDFPTEKKVELAIEWALRPPGSFCDGLDQAMGFCKPMDDQTGFRQAGEADHDSFRGWHDLSLVYFPDDGDCCFDLFGVKIAKIVPK
jgi:hypothetical protein